MKALVTQKLRRWFADYYPESISAAREQQGQESFYARRRPEDSVLDPDKKLDELFNLLRNVDNNRYPEFLP